MPVTDKRFFTSTLIKAAGCSADTLRSWRNRNGLFPETQGSDGWNKFSVIDFLVCRIVAALTKRGIAAQLAVDAAMSSTPLLAELCEYSSADFDPDDLTDIFLEVGYKIAKSKAVLGISIVDGRVRSVQLLNDNATLRSILDQHFSMLIDLREMIFAVGQLIIDDVEFINSLGELTLNPRPYNEFLDHPSRKGAA